ncbi:MAG: tetratricopeptide repeat protein [Gammaproteobacteria bacterium]
MCRRIVLVLAPLLAGGCAYLPQAEPPTIASLGKHGLELQDTTIEASEARAMQAYRRFLEIEAESASRPLAMRRLADLNLEAEEVPQAGQEQLYPRQIDDSVQLYRDILARYPERPDNDKVQYQLARAYEHSGRPAESLTALGQLIARYPDSNYTQEAQFRRGEILFVEQDYRAAEQAYQRVVDAGNTGPYYQQALYKQGWCLFKQSLFAAGLDAFITLLDMHLQTQPAGADRLGHLTRADREVVEDTLRVVSLSFSYEDGPASVSDYFRRQGSRHYEDVIYDSLGALYLHKERYTDAAETFRAFVAHNPVHREAPRFQMRVIETYQKGKFPTLVLAAKQEFVDRYNLHTEYWQVHDRVQAGAVLDYLKTTMTDLARHYHALAQRTRKAADYQQATHWYRSYLDSFPATKEAARMNFLLAELLFESGDYPRATHEYQRTAYDYGAHEHAADAGYAAVLAFAREQQRLSGAAQQAWHRQAIEHGLRFSTTFPAHPQALAVMTRASEDLLALGEYERAAQVAEQVIAADGTAPEQQRVAWTVQAHARFDLQDYLQAEHAYQQVLQLMPGQSEQKNELIDKLAASIYKQGEEARSQDDTAAAVAHFLRIREMAPTAAIVATAEFDAAAGLMSLQDWPRATSVLERFRNSYPDHPQQAEVTRRLATAYLAEAQPLQAAIEFERIGRSHTDSGLRREALWQSAELYARAQRPEQSIEMYQHYITQFPAPAEAAIEARQHIADHYSTAGATQQAQHWLTEIISADRIAGAGRNDRTRYLAAQASFKLAEAVYENYRTVRLDLPLKRSLAAKKQLMEQALQRYAQAAAYQIAEVTTAATFRTADIYFQLSRALLESTRPANLSGEALEQYDILLEEQAYPFEEQAIDLHETNIQRISNGGYDTWIAQSLQQLAQLLPARYAKTERSVTHVEAIH